MTKEETTKISNQNRKEKNIYITVGDEQSADVDVAAMCGYEERRLRSLRDPRAFLVFVDDVIEGRRVEGMIGRNTAIQQLKREK